MNSPWSTTYPVTVFVARADVRYEIYAERPLSDDELSDVIECYNSETISSIPARVQKAQPADPACRLGAGSNDTTSR